MYFPVLSAAFPSIKYLITKVLDGIFSIRIKYASASSVFGAISKSGKLYLDPSDEWEKDGARFAAYFFGNGDKWVSMTDSDKDGIYDKLDLCPNTPLNVEVDANGWPLDTDGDGVAD